MPAAAIEITNVDKSFGRHRVLNGLSLAVESGKTFAFLGRNAAGKSTTIRIMMGLLRPDAGEITVMGLDPRRDALELKRRVGFLAEDQTMWGWMTVEELLRFMAPFYPTWDHPLALRFTRDFELPLQSKIKNLSKGQNVRLGLVLVLAHRPELVILDDPALGLDPIMRKQLNRDIISHLQGEGRTVFYSSHLLHEVETIADEIAILDGGRIVRQATTDALRGDVKQIIVPVTALADRFVVGRILDQQQTGDEVAITVESAPRTIEALCQADVSHRVVELNLDEIFEAYVAGRRPPLNTFWRSRPIDELKLYWIKWFTGLGVIGTFTGLGVAMYFGLSGFGGEDQSQLKREVATHILTMGVAVYVAAVTITYLVRHGLYAAILSFAVTLIPFCVIASIPGEIRERLGHDESWNYDIMIAANFLVTGVGIMLGRSAVKHDWGWKKPS